MKFYQPITFKWYPDFINKSSDFLFENTAEGLNCYFVKIRNQLIGSTKNIIITEIDEQEFY